MATVTLNAQVLSRRLLAIRGNFIVIQSLFATIKVGALLVLVGAGLLFSGLDLRSEPQAAEAAFPGQLKQLISSDSNPFGHHFGGNVSVSGDTAVVGASEEAEGDGFAGAAYIFQRDQGGVGNWGEVATLTGSTDAGDVFGSSVAIDNNTVVVGAKREDTFGQDVGAAYVFERNEGGLNNWGEVAKLSSTNTHRVGSFGGSVAVSGDTVVVGAPNTVTEEPCTFSEFGFAGTAHVFQRNHGGPGNWGEVKTLCPSPVQSGAHFGNSVAIRGEIAVVGANQEDVFDDDEGAAYVFQRNQDGTDNWGQVAKLTASDAEVDDRFGFSVAVSGDTAFVGAPAEDTVANNAGATYVFERDEGSQDNWGEVAKLTSSDGGGFGGAAALDGNTAVVGAPQSHGLNGAIYVYQRGQSGPSDWGEPKKFLASGSRFGGGVAVSGDVIVSGAAFGAAYALESQNTPTGTDVEVSPGSGVTVRFPTVTEAGETTVTTSTAGPPPPTGFRIFGTGGQPVYYDINTTAAFTGTAIVCIEYEEPQGNDGNLKLQKFNPPFKDITQSVDIDNNIICGKTTSFSIFAITEPLPPPGVGGIALDDSVSLRPLETSESSSGFGLIAWAIAAGAGAFGLGSAAWYVRRKRVAQ